MQAPWQLSACLVDSESSAADVGVALLLQEAELLLPLTPLFIYAALLLLLLCWQVHLVDVTDPYKLKTLDIYQLPPNAGGHVVRYNKEANMAAVATYFLDVTGESLGGAVPSFAGTRCRYRLSIGDTGRFRRHAP